MEPGVILLTSFNLNYFLCGPISKCSHSGDWSFSIQLWGGEGDPISSRAGATTRLDAVMFLCCPNSSFRDARTCIFGVPRETHGSGRLYSLLVQMSREAIFKVLISLSGMKSIILPFTESTQQGRDDFVGHLPGSSFSSAGIRWAQRVLNKDCIPQPPFQSEGVAPRADPG